MNNTPIATAPTPETISRLFAPCLQSRRESEDPAYLYNDPSTDRRFEVRLVGDGSFFLSECIPNGRLVEYDSKGKLVKAWTDARVEAAIKEGPNGFSAAADRAGVNPAWIVRIVDGYGINTIYHSSLDSCIAAIRESLLTNTWYRSTRELTAEEVATKEAMWRRASQAHWKDEETLLTNGEANERGIFLGCHAMMGPLQDEVKSSILSYINEPTFEKWEAVRSYCIAGPTTLWQAWGLVDSSAPMVGDSNKHPSGETLITAIRQAVKDRKDRVQEKLSEFKKEACLTIVR